MKSTYLLNLLLPIALLLSKAPVARTAEPLNGSDGPDAMLSNIMHAMSRITSEPVRRAKETPMKRLRQAALGHLTIASTNFVPKPMTAGQDTHLVFLPIVSKPPIPLEQLSLAYISDRDGNGEVYSMRGNGQTQINLTNNPAMDYWPVWSPDGTQIAFTTARDGNMEIYRMQADGTEQLNLTGNSAYDDEPTWSPDGSHIAFRSDRDGNDEIYTMDSDGTGAINLTNTPARDTSPAWSPDGMQIAFVSDRDGEPALYVMQADGASPTRLANASLLCQPAWSPDGSRIAYILDNELYVTTISNTLTIQLTDFGASPDWSSMSGPSWSPSGEYILFSYVDFILPSATACVYKIKADGSEPQATALATGSNAAWSPDGAYIAFNTKSYPIAGQQAALVRMKSDGSEQTILADQGNNWGPTWTLLPATLP